LALIRAAADDKDHFTLQSDVLRALAVAFRPVWSQSGTEMSPGTGTEMSPGTGTEMSPGAMLSVSRQIEALQAIRRFLGRGGIAFSGTEMSPGTGTEMSPGTGTEMSPGAIFSAAEMIRTLESVRNLVRARIGVFSSGTEMSPGTGTEMSPGTGTEMSPGAIFSAAQVIRVLQEAERLIRTGSLFSGTEMSPGTGTDMSPGAIFDRPFEQISVTFEALVRYASLLRSKKALLVSGMEGR
jgi:hypothetical protein